MARALGPILLAGVAIAAGPAGWVAAGLSFGAAGVAMPPLLHRLAGAQERGAASNQVPVS